MRGTSPAHLPLPSSRGSCVHPPLAALWGTDDSCCCWMVYEWKSADWWASHSCFHEVHNFKLLWDFYFIFLSLYLFTAFWWNHCRQQPLVSTAAWSVFSRQPTCNQCAGRKLMGAPGETFQWKASYKYLQCRKTYILSLYLSNTTLS